MNATDLNSWKTTTIILVLISLAMFAVQRSSLMFLDVVFEFCIFHVPTIIAVGIYAYLRKKQVPP